jgi:hypothetical protein
MGSVFAVALLPPLSAMQVLFLVGMVVLRYPAPAEPHQSN